MSFECLVSEAGPALRCVLSCGLKSAYSGQRTEKTQDARHKTKDLKLKIEEWTPAYYFAGAGKNENITLKKRAPAFFEAWTPDNNIPGPALRFYPSSPTAAPRPALRYGGQQL